MMQSVLTAGVVAYPTIEKDENGRPVNVMRTVYCTQVVIGGTNSPKGEDAMARRFKTIHLQGSVRSGRGAVNYMIAGSRGLDAATQAELDEQERKAHFIVAMGFKAVQCGVLPLPCDDLLRFHLGVTAVWLEEHHPDVLRNIRDIEVALSTAMALTMRLAQHHVFCSEASPLRLRDGSFQDFRWAQLRQMAPYLFTPEDVVFFVLSDVIYSAVDPFAHDILVWLARVEANYACDLLWNSGSADDGAMDTDNDSDEDDDGGGPRRARRAAETAGADRNDVEREYRRLADALFGSREGRRPVHVLGMPWTDRHRAPVRKRRRGDGDEDEDVADYPLRSGKAMRAAMAAEAHLVLYAAAHGEGEGEGEGGDCYDDYGPPMPWSYKVEKHVQRTLDSDRERMVNPNYVRVPCAVPQCAKAFVSLRPTSKMSVDDVCSMLHGLSGRNVKAKYLPLVSEVSVDMLRDIERHRTRLWEDARCETHTVPVFIAGQSCCYVR
jgi:hypothetical protein